MQRIPCLRANCDRVINRLHRNLELQHDAVGGLQRLGGGVNVGRLQRIVRSLHHQNAVLPVGLDEDRRDAARQSLDLLHVSGINSLLAEIFNGRGTEQIAADARDHEHLRAAETRRYRLIRALASETEIESLPEDGFARLRELIRECRQIDVGAANHRNSRALCHSALSLSPKGCGTPSLFSARRLCQSSLEFVERPMTCRRGSDRTFCYSFVPRC